MLTPSDGRNDGQKISYLQNPTRWRAIDPELFDALAMAIGSEGDRRLSHIETKGIIAGAVYFNETVPNAIIPRAQWFGKVQDTLKGAQIIFYDPDNGVAPSLPKGRHGSSKYIYPDEIAATFAAGHSVLLYQHFPRRPRGAFLAELRGKLAAIAPDSHITVLQTSHVAFVMLTHPEHQSQLEPIKLAQTWANLLLL